MGTLNSIERYDISQKRVIMLEIKMPYPLRRFATVKISMTKILLMGGIGRLSKDSDAVYCFDIDDGVNSGVNDQARSTYSIENLDRIDKPGVIDYPVIIDSVGCLHLFIENASGTSPLMRSVYSFLEYSWGLGRPQRSRLNHKMLSSFPSFNTCFEHGLLWSDIECGVLITLARPHTQIVNSINHLKRLNIDFKKLKPEERININDTKDQINKKCSY